MTKLFKSVNISLVAAIIMIVATALNFADEIKFTATMPGDVTDGNTVRGARGVIGNPVGGWGPGGDNWQVYQPDNYWLYVGNGLSLGYSEPTNTFTVNGTASISGNVIFGSSLDVSGSLNIDSGDLGVTGSITTDGDVDAGMSISGASLIAGVLSADNTSVNMDGNIYQWRESLNGFNQIHPDYVFEPDYKLESIEEHARVMWEEKHLPAIPVPEKSDDGTYVTEIGSQQRGLLEELEKAHIYVTRLKEMLDKQGEKITRLEDKYD